VGNGLHRKAYVWALIGAFLFAVVAWLVAKQSVESFDSRIIAEVQGRESEALTRMAEGFSRIGSTTGVISISIVMMAVLAWRLGHRKELVLFALAVGGAALLNVVLKNAFRRDRPSIHRLIEETGYSFPSGHSMAAFALYGILAYLLWRHARTALGRVLVAGLAAAVTLCIGLSRIYLGVHYPSDVIAGYLASGVWLGAIIEAYARWTAGRSKAR